MAWQTRSAAGRWDGGACEHFDNDEKKDQGEQTKEDAPLKKQEISAKHGLK